MNLRNASGSAPTDNGADNSRLADSPRFGGIDCSIPVCLTHDEHLAGDWSYSRAATPAPDAPGDEPEQEHAEKEQEHPRVVHHDLPSRVSRDSEAFDEGLEKELPNVDVRSRKVRRDVRQHLILLAPTSAHVSYAVRTAARFARRAPTQPQSSVTPAASGTTRRARETPPNRAIVPTAERCRQFAGSRDEESSLTKVRDRLNCDTESIGQVTEIGV